MTHDRNLGVGGLWDKGVFKIKRSDKTGAAYRFQDTSCCTRFRDGESLGKDYLQNFSPTPGIAIARIITSIAAANDLELHSIDIEQAFLQADKLMEGVNGRYFINPPPGSPDANNKDIVYEVLRPLYGNPSSPRALHKTMDAFFKSEGFDTIGFEESVWKRVGGGKYAEDIYVSAHVDDCLIACQSKDIMTAFKKEILTRFIGTDEGEVTEYLGCELIRNRSAKMPIVSSEHDETRSRVCILSAKHVRTIPRSSTFASCRACIAICARYL